MYDSPEYNVHGIMGPILCSFASGLAATAATNTYSQTSANVHDRIQFFRNVKVTGIKAITRTMGIGTGTKISSHNPRIRLQAGGTDRATNILGTVAGVSTEGAIVAATPNIDVTDTCQIKLTITGDGTAAAMDQVSADVWIEYQHRLT